MDGSVGGLNFSLLDKFFYGPLFVIFVYLVISWAFGEEETSPKPQSGFPAEQPVLTNEDWGKTFVPSSLLIKPLASKVIPKSGSKAMSHKNTAQKSEPFHFPLYHSLRQEKSYTPMIDKENLKLKNSVQNNMTTPIWSTTQDFTESSSALISDQSLLDLLEGEDEAISPNFRNKQKQVTFDTFKTGLARKSEAPRQPRLELQNTGEPENSHGLNFIFNRFSIEDFSKVSLLGQGSAGTVWKVNHKSTGKKYALKVLNSVSKFTAEQLKRLESKILCQSKLHHPNILILYGAFQNGDMISLVLEYASFGSLSSNLNPECPLSEQVASKLMYQLLSALQHIHSHNYIHRDIKPSNLFLNEKGELKVGDFGCVAELKNKKMETGFFGTLHYLAPEMIQQYPYDSSVDIWAAGVVAFELLVGRPPFEDPFITEQSICRNICFAPQKLPMTVSSSARDFISRAMIIDPLLRPSALNLLRHEWILRHN